MVFCRALLCLRIRASVCGGVCARARWVRIANTHTPSAPVYDEVRGMLKTFLKSIMADTVCVCELTKRRTVSAGPAKQSVVVCHQCFLCDACRWVVCATACCQPHTDRLLVLPRPPTCCTP